MPTLEQHMQRAHETLLARCQESLIRDAAIQAISQVKISWNTRMRTKAGEAHMKANMRLINGAAKPLIYEAWIEISQSVVGPLSDEDTYEIVSHEYAHIVDYYFRGDSGHDETWKHIHQLMGGSGSRLHAFTVKRNTVRRYIFKNTITGKECFMKNKTWKVWKSGLYSFPEPGWQPDRVEYKQGKTVVRTERISALDFEGKRNSISA